jgi:hypothetical protein
MIRAIVVLGVLWLGIGDAHAQVFKPRTVHGKALAKKGPAAAQAATAPTPAADKSGERPTRTGAAQTIDKAPVVEKKAAPTVVAKKAPVVSKKAAAKSDDSDDDDDDDKPAKKAPPPKKAPPAKKSKDDVVVKDDDDE